MRGKQADENGAIPVLKMKQNQEPWVSGKFCVLACVPVSRVSHFWVSMSVQSVVLRKYLEYNWSLVKKGSSSETQSSLVPSISPFSYKDTHHHMVVNFVFCIYF